MSATTPLRRSARLARTTDATAPLSSDAHTAAHDHPPRKRWWKHGFCLSSACYQDDPSEPKCWLRGWMFLFGIAWIVSQPARAPQFTVSALCQLPTFVLSIVFHQTLVIFSPRLTEFILFLDIAAIGLSVLANGVFLLETVGGHEAWIGAALALFCARIAFDTWCMATQTAYLARFHSSTRWKYVLLTNVFSVACFLYTRRCLIWQFWVLPFGYAVGFAFYLSKHICLNFHEGLHFCVLMCFYARCFELPHLV